MHIFMTMKENPLNPVYKAVIINCHKNVPKLLYMKYIKRSKETFLQATTEGVFNFIPFCSEGLVGVAMGDDWPLLWL